MNVSFRLRSLALLGALALGLIGSGVGSGGCLIPDYCIYVSSEGTDWCSQIAGAMMWPEGQPELAKPVRVGGVLPEGCVCMNAGEEEILEDQAPADHHAALVAEVEAATRLACVAAVLDGYTSNCLATEDGVVPAPVFTQPAGGESNPACVGSCDYIGDPPFAEPCEDPDPWECNGEDPPGSGGETGGGETGGGGPGGETGGTTGLGPVDDGSLAR